MYTIIIPVYNAEKTIRQCLESILCQSNKDFELILINDGSIDTSGDICNEYASKDSRIKVFHKPNGGVSSARNLGLEHAKGEWITFIDADDYVEPLFLNIIPEDDDSLIITNWKPTTSNDYTEYISPEVIIGKKRVNQFINNNLQLDVLRCPWAKFFKRSILKNNNIFFDERFKIGEDTLFVMTYLYYCQRIKIKKDGLYRYYQRPCDESNIKYQLDFDVSIAYLKELCYRYKKLKCNNKKFLNLLYHFYKGKTKNINNPYIEKKWLYNPVVIQMLWLTYYKGDYKRYVIFLKLCLQSLFNSR